MISLPMNKLLYANQHSTCEINTDLEEGGKNYGISSNFIIVDRGLGHEVVDVATEAGARGATIINARGSGIHEKRCFFQLI